ncbi:beta-1,3-galactosyltransferase 2 [Xenopus laevis]|uniref:Hexosyltransferase n=2 Tax=Xenopus laevis TaxID=8355 RepID=A0A1L8GNA5_XENLA|nr:beta-1,3-galactosyltransferase 2 [Xenopus laevis]XP_041446571.1 beta-1,3-galactosyltransferase 2 [Xenopus laevis]OCT85324.1 hypothetical protein XELAEV_18023490mg [Xenopus laevis]
MSSWRRRHCFPLGWNWHTNRFLFHCFVLLFLLFFMFLLFNNNRWLPRQIIYRGIVEVDNTYSFQSKVSESIPKVFQKLVVSRSKNNQSNHRKVQYRRLPTVEITSNGASQNTPHYGYIINEAKKCQKSTPFLLLLISVEPQQLNAREAIRQTWGKEDLFPGIQIVTLFLLGRDAKGTGTTDQTIINESSQYHDIIQQNYLDTYNNLTVKTLMGMHWITTFCPKVAYVMKTDSDMFVNTEHLIYGLLKPEIAPQTNYFTGYFMKGYAPNRNKKSKWYMSQELYPGDLYPPFCSGTGYVFSGDLAEKIYKVSLSIPRLHLEDVYIGVCLAKLGIKPVPPPKESDFNIWRVYYSDCVYNQIVTSHQFQPTELLKYWNQLQQNKHACSKTHK